MEIHIKIGKSELPITEKLPTRKVHRHGNYLAGCTNNSIKLHAAHRRALCRPILNALFQHIIIKWKEQVKEKIEEGWHQSSKVEEDSALHFIQIK